MGLGILCNFGSDISQFRSNDGDRAKDSGSAGEFQSGIGVHLFRLHHGFDHDSKYSDILSYFDIFLIRIGASHFVVLAAVGLSQSILVFGTFQHSEVCSSNTRIIDHDSSLIHLSIYPANIQLILAVLVGNRLPGPTPDVSG